MTARLLFLLIALPLIGGADAQTPARTVSARVVYFDRTPEDSQELFVANGTDGGFLKIEPGQGVDGESVSCPVDASGKVDFRKSQSSPDVVASATVPQDVHKAVMFFLRLPKPNGTKIYQVLVVDESTKTLPKGGGYVCNLAGKSSRITLGELKYELPPGKSISLKRPATLNEYNMAPFQVQMQNGETWSRVKDAMMRFSDSERYFILTYLENGTRPAVKVFKQVAEEPAGPPTP